MHKHYVSSCEISRESTCLRPRTEAAQKQERVPLLFSVPQSSLVCEEPSITRAQSEEKLSWHEVDSKRFDIAQKRE